VSYTPETLHIWLVTHVPNIQFCSWIKLLGGVLADGGAGRLGTARGNGGDAAGDDIAQTGH
jgi:hypothetical protein